MNGFQITTGAVPVMTTSTGRTDMSFDPVLQILNIKAIGQPVPGSTSGLRYRVSLTDGLQTAIGIISSGLAGLIQDSQIVEHSIVRLKQFTVNQNQGTAMIVVIDLEVVCLNAPPLSMEQQQPPSFPPQHGSSSSSSSMAGGGGPSGYNAPAASTASSAYGAYGGASVNKPVMRSDGMAAGSIPIKALNPYSNKWTIKARITSKSDKRSWNNAKGQGTLFSVDLLDADGSEIRGTFFKDACDKFYPMLEQDRVYLFSGGKLKPVGNTVYNTLKNGYEITFDVGSSIQPSDDEGDIKTQCYNFVKLADIGGDDMVGKTIDVLAYVRNFTEPQTVNSKDGKTFEKRELMVLDESGVEIKLALWGEKALQDPGWVSKPIVAFKSVKVGDFQGRSLSVAHGGSFQLNPNIPEGHALYNHYLSVEGGLENFKAASMSTGGGGGRDTYDALDKRKTVAEIKGMGQGEKPDYFTMSGSVSFVKHDNDPWYTACIGPDCKKKVTEDMGQWRCEKCGVTYEDCKRRYILQSSICDLFGTQWVTFFDEAGVKLLGMEAQELYILKEEHGEAAYNRVFQEALFRPLLLKAKAKVEQMPDGGDQRLKVTVSAFQDLDFASESRMLLEAIERWA